MTPETRRNVFRYGIAIDLVILATGAGMLMPAPTALLLLFGAAVLLSLWKGGWQGGVAALALSVLALATMFSLSATPLMLFAAAMLTCVAVQWVSQRSARVAVATTAAPVDLVNVEEERARTAREVEERLAAERAEAEREKARLEEERVRTQRELEAQLAKERKESKREKARLAKEREQAEREKARLAKEREAAEREKARLEEERARVARELEERLAAERAEAEREKIRLEEERARVACELEERLAAERAEAEREKVRLEEERARVARELEERLAAERAEAEREKVRLEEERAAVARELEERLAAERAEAEREQARLAQEREQAEREKARLEEERQRAEQELQARLAREREEAEREKARLAKEREELEARIAQEREAMRLQLEQQLAAEREAITREAEARIEEAKRAAVPAAPAPAPAPVAKVASAAPAGPKTSLLDTVTGWFRREPRTRPNLNTKRIHTNGSSSATKRAPAPQRRPTSSSTATHKSTASPKVRRPRLVLLERRRATADTVLPKLRQRGIEVTVVERWVDAVDELLRVKPDAFLIDVEHPDFDRAHRTTMEKSANLPIVLTGRNPNAAPPNVAYSSFTVRPYDAEELVRIAEQAMAKPDELLAVQMIQRTPAASAVKPIPVVTVHAPVKRPEPPPRADVVVAMKPGSNEEYEVQCFTCRVGFNAVESDWCSCLTKERTLVCTNCLTCFCKAPPAYKEKFWVEAPPRLFERKTAEARKNGGLAANPPLSEVTRPLVLTVEDDEEIQAIVQRVCANLGYGFIYATNGQDGLDLAHEYRPNMILSDAFMPKLDGREMCRQLKDEPEFADTRMVVMTGLYTDTKYRSEALKRFHVDDYIAKPVAITDLINLLQRHLEGVSGLPVQDDLHELHRRDVAESIEEDDIDVPLSEVLAAPDTPQLQISAPVASTPAPARPDAYEVCCVNCNAMFDATRAEWCRCVGRDNTLVCTECGGCFCKAAAAYKERFWIDAPPSLFERKMIGSKRNLGARANPAPTDVKRPLILLVEDDENVQLIVRTVVTTMGFGFVVGANGQEGLSLAREYSPDLILSDAFMPKLDGREMCRLLKEDPTTSRSKAIIMTGLYTDRKYRNEALDYFKVDDYVAKPLAVDDLIKLFKKHLPQEVATAH